MQHSLSIFICTVDVSTRVHQSVNKFQIDDFIIHHGLPQFGKILDESSIAGYSHLGIHGFGQSCRHGVGIVIMNVIQADASAHPLHIV